MPKQECCCVCQLKANLPNQAEHVVRFSLSLNNYGNVEIIGDSEPTMKALLTYVKTLRHSLGLETTITFSMKKGQNQSS